MMQYRAILFDLDGTLLPMDMDEFTRGYFSHLSKKMAGYGYEKQSLIRAIWSGTAAMVGNDGAKSNADRFWDSFCGQFGQQAREHIPVFDAFYSNEFHNVIHDTKPDPAAARAAVDAARSAADAVILATNPIFPMSAVQSRLEWIGLQPEDFDDISTYENSTFCKPNPLYYTQVLERAGIRPQDALMVGNDVEEDIHASAQAGLHSILITDCAINKRDLPVNVPCCALKDLPGLLI